MYHRILSIKTEMMLIYYQVLRNNTLLEDRRYNNNLVKTVKISKCYRQ